MNSWAIARRAFGTDAGSYAPRSESKLSLPAIEGRLFGTVPGAPRSGNNHAGRMRERSCTPPGFQCPGSGCAAWRRRELTGNPLPRTEQPILRHCKHHACPRSLRATPFVHPLSTILHPAQREAQRFRHRGSPPATLGGGGFPWGETGKGASMILPIPQKLLSIPTVLQDSFSSYQVLRSRGTPDEIGMAIPPIRPTPATAPDTIEIGSLLRPDSSGGVLSGAGPPGTLLALSPRSRASDRRRPGGRRRRS